MVDIQSNTASWADVKYHVPTGIGFSPKASGFYPFGDATDLAGEVGVGDVGWLVQAPAWNQTYHSTNDRCEALASAKGCFLCFCFGHPHMPKGRLQTKGTVLLGCGLVCSRCVDTFTLLFAPKTDQKNRPLVWKSTYNHTQCTITGAYTMSPYREWIQKQNDFLKRGCINLPKRFCMVGTRHFASAPNDWYSL